MWALAFFMAFNRAASFQPGLVSETLSVRTFHFIEQNLTNYYEMMLTDRCLLYTSDAADEERLV